jgi:hypothetical protein
MDIVSEQVYLPSYRRKRKARTTVLIVVSSWVLVYWIEKQTGVLSRIWRPISR